ncbi:uncharacterized protein CG3556-like [Centruroides sculpturatus]|uniref:uncharacterized protein CG3556-like n=1 Tax=Centruroides sculpturatus TaxID=218467 RepID=UPI000C6CA784|nr:uncharacterized protein CG3556-like [Centruroides sculpturatus]
MAIKLILLILCSVAYCKVSRDDIRHIDGIDEALEKGINWLKKEREQNCGWKDTARAIVALFLTVEEFDKYEKELMAKEFDLAVFLQLRNINSLLVEEMALNINAMIAACRNPKYYYNIDFIQLMLNRIRHQAHISSPLIPLVFCNANVSEARDYHDTLISFMNLDGPEPRYADLKVFSALAIECIYQEEEHKHHRYSSNTLKSQKELQSSDGSFGNIYLTALTVQLALATGDLSEEIENAIKYLISKQLEDGSFGNMMTTYFVLPILAGKTLIDLKYTKCEEEECRKPASYSVDLDPNVKLESVLFQLMLDEKKEATRSIVVKVPSQSKFLEVMKVAASRDAAYRFEYSGDEGKEVVHSIGGKYNDPELQKYWELFMHDKEQTRLMSVSDPIRPGIYSYSFNYKAKHG